MLIRLEAVPGGYVSVTDDWETAQKALQEGEAVIGILSDDTDDSPRPAGCWSGVSHFITDVSALEDTFYVQEAYCRFHHLPMIIYQDEDVILREMMPADAKELWELHSEESVRTFVPLPADSLEELPTVIESYCENIYSCYHCGIWVIADAVTGRVIGRAGIEPRTEQSKVWDMVTNEECSVEGFFLGYLIAEVYRGRHLTERICRQALLYAAEELELAEIYCRIAPDNQPSVHLAKKLGFEQIGEEIYLCRL